MTSVMDSEEDLSVFEALKDRSGSQCKRYRRSLPDGAGLIRARAKVMEYHEAMEKAKERCALDQGRGQDRSVIGRHLSGPVYH